MRYRRFLILSLVCVMLMLALQPQWAVQAQAVVYVRTDGDDTNCDGTANAAYPGSGGPGLACAFATIQHAVDTVDAGGTVNVNAGTYVENNIAITQSVVLIGDPGDTSEPGGLGPGASAPVVDGGGAASPVFDVRASDVTIQGFHIQNVHTTAPGTAVGIRGGSGGVCDNVSLLDNYITDVQWAGIMHWSGGAFVSSNWDVRRNAVEMGPYSQDTNVYGIELTNTQNSTIAYNILSGGYQGIVVTAQNYSAPVVSQNISVISNQLSGGFADAQLLLWSLDLQGGADLTNVTISNNTFFGSTDGILSWVYLGAAAISNVTISGNTFNKSNPVDATYIINLGDASGTNTISNNTFVHEGATAATWSHAINVTGPYTGTVNITTNNFDGSAAGTYGVGVRVRDNLPGTAMVNITGNTIENYQGTSGYGVRASDLVNSPTVVIYDNCFDNNTFGVGNGGQTITLDADGNYWGAISGPYHPSLNPDGLGDAVTDGVAFTPWFEYCHNQQPTPTPTATATVTPTPTVTMTLTTTPAPGENVLPETGFAPGMVTALGEAQAAYARLAASDDAAAGMALLIPKLGVEVPVLGVPQTADGWEVRWLGNYVGWLSGTAFPTWEGNTVLTGHVYNSTGLPGIFVNLNRLAWGDQLVITAWGEEHVYEVRAVDYIDADDVDAVMHHEEQDWLTLMTCYGFDEATGLFTQRLIVRAVRVD